jgi:hypothetical protein
MTLRERGNGQGPADRVAVRRGRQQAAQTILHLFVEVTRTIEQEDFEGWLKNRLLGGS